MAKPKPFQATTVQGFCILDDADPRQLCGNATFDNKEDAQRHLDHRAKMFGRDYSRHKIAPCIVMIRLVEYETF